MLEAVVEVTEDNTGAVLDSGTFGFILNFSSGPSQYLSCFTQDERDSWKAAIEFASHTATRQRLKDLQDKVSKLTDTMTSSDDDEVTLDSTVIDPNTAPVLECSMSCDNLLCDALGRSPSARMMVYLRNSDQSSWKLYASTEVVEVSFTNIFFSYNIDSIFLQKCRRAELQTYHHFRSKIFACYLSKSFVWDFQHELN